MAATDHQVRKLFMEYQKTGVIVTSAMKAVSFEGSGASRGQPSSY